MKIAVLSGFTTSLFWFRKDMMLDFRAAGHEVLAVGDGPEEEWRGRFEELGIRYRSIPVQRNGTNPLKDAGTLLALRRLLAEERPDRIFAYQAKTVIYGGMAARMLGIGEFYPLIAGAGSVFMGGGMKRRLVRAVMTAEYRVGMKGARRVFFQNGDDLALFESARIVRRENCVMLSGSGVNVREFTARPQPESPGFLCIARLIRDKGVAEYLEACRILRQRRPGARCVLVGPFDSNPSAITREYLRGFTADGTVEYAGEQRDVRPYLESCSVFVLPSYREGTPKTVLEAMATGRAVITTDAPGCREPVRQGINGLFVPVRDVNALADAMTELYDDPERAERMGQAGRLLAEEKYDVRKVNGVILATMGLSEQKVD